MEMNILVSQHPTYNYMDASLCQGLQNLGHDVFSVGAPGSNYVERKWTGTSVDLFIQFIKGMRSLDGTPSIMVWGEDDHKGLQDELTKGFEKVFVRDHLPGTPGIPINFAIEDRYYCSTENGYKLLRDRDFDICFLGKLYPSRLAIIERLKADFPSLNMLLGPRTFNTPDSVWSRWTQPWCSHDQAYFETLANSKICLSLLGAGPDCSRTWEALASGAVCVLEYANINMVKPYPKLNVFRDYAWLNYHISTVLANLDHYQGLMTSTFEWNKEHHSTKARAQYLLEQCGLA
jgi:hypothetical protein